MSNVKTKICPQCGYDMLKIKHETEPGHKCPNRDCGFFIFDWRLRKARLENAPKQLGLFDVSYDDIPF